jgi:hypothetical protein
MAKDDDYWEEKTARLELRSTPTLLRLIDDWRRRQADLPGRSEAIRRMVEIAAKLDKGRRK